MTGRFVKGPQARVNGDEVAESFCVGDKAEREPSSVAVFVGDEELESCAGLALTTVSLDVCYRVLVVIVH